MSTLFLVEILLFNKEFGLRSYVFFDIYIFIYIYQNSNIYIYINIYISK